MYLLAVQPSQKWCFKCGPRWTSHGKSKTQKTTPTFLYLPGWMKYINIHKRSFHSLLIFPLQPADFSPRCPHAWCLASSFHWSTWMNQWSAEYLTTDPPFVSMKKWVLSHSSNVFKHFLELFGVVEGMKSCVNPKSRPWAMVQTWVIHNYINHPQLEVC